VPCGLRVWGGSVVHDAVCYRSFLFYILWCINADGSAPLRGTSAVHGTKVTARITVSLRRNATVRLSHCCSQHAACCSLTPPWHAAGALRRGPVWGHQQPNNVDSVKSATIHDARG